MKCRYFLTFIFTAVFIISCHNNKDKRVTMNVLENIVGKTLYYSDSLSLRLMGDSISDFGNLNRNTVKIVSYTTSFLCTECNLGILEKWKKMIEEIISDFGNKVDFVFIFDQRKKDEAELTKLLKEFYFDHPVYYDLEGYFMKQNVFIPPNPLYHTFLTDTDNKIILVGNPLQGRSVKNLYINTIKNMFSQ